MDIGCGRCDELSLLVELFPQATLTLIDNDPASIGYLKKLCGSGMPQVKVVLADARALDRAARGPHDLALIRHPDLDAQPDVWDTVIHLAVNELAAGAALVVTTYSTAEAETVRRSLALLPVRELAAQPFVEIPVALAGNDRYILSWVRH